MMIVLDIKQVTTGLPKMVSLMQMIVVESHNPSLKDAWLTLVKICAIVIIAINLKIKIMIMTMGINDL